MTDLNDDEKSRLRSAAMSALALVSRADPGFFDMFKESSAGAKALAEAPPELREVFVGFSIPQLDRSADLETQVLDQLRAAVALLAAKDANLATGYRNVVGTAVDRVAAAADGTSAAETEVANKIKAALAG